MKISDIVKKYDITRSTINYSTTYFNINYKNNLELRNQILLGSILGDGYIQNRNNIFVYRECHTLDENDYLKWKFLMMDNWTLGNRIYNKNYNNKYSNAKEFCTKYKFSNDLKYYYEMSLSDVVKQINIFGLLIFLLDDGWYSNHSNNGNFLISSGSLSINILQQLQNKFKQYDINTQLIGKRKDISISSDNNFLLLSYLQQIFQKLDIDIINKKFNKVKLNLKNLLF